MVQCLLNGELKMSKKDQNTLLKNLLEYIPIAVFFVVFIFFKDDKILLFGRDLSGFVLATLVFVPLVVLATAVSWFVLKEVSRIQLLTLVLVVVFGGMTIFFNDERFLKIKPTLIYCLFSIILLFGIFRKTSYLASLLGKALPLSYDGWMILTRRMAYFFLFLAATNEFVWRTQSTETWVYFKTFGLTIAMFAFFITQYSVFKTYGDFKD